MADHATQQLRVNDCTIEIMKGGSGEPLLYLHGAGGSKGWAPFLDQLSDRFSVLAPDHPGFGNSDTPGWQRVDPGDATDLVNSQTTAVLALDGNRVILGLTVESPVMTPNGDGRNDETIFNFNIARISSEQTITVAIYDLSGSMVGQVTEERKDPRGGYSMPWKGQDTKGDLVPPGIYIARIEVDSQSASAASTSVQRLVHVAY